MIKLGVESYCHHCLDFEVIDNYVAGSDHRILCKHWRKCRAIHIDMDTRLKKELEDLHDMIGVLEKCNNTYMEANQIYKERIELLEKKLAEKETGSDDPSN